MEAIVSIISLMVIATVTVILLYQNASVRDQVASNMQSVVDQINDSTYYGYQYDKKQENNIKNLDKNLQTIYKDVNSVSDQVKTMQTQYPSTSQISDSVITKNAKTGILRLGDKFSLSGVGEKLGDDEWLRLMNIKGDALYGGIGADKLYIQNGALIKGVTTLDNVTVGNTLQTKGGASEHNTQLLPSVFNDTDKKNYIRGDTEIRGNTIIPGDLSIGRDLKVKNSIAMSRSDVGPFLSNKTDKGAEYGFGAYAGDDLRLYNTNVDGTIKIGYGLDKDFAPVVEMTRTKAGGSATMLGSGTNRLAVANVSDVNKWSPLADIDEIVIRSENENKRMFIQNGRNPGIVLNKNSVGVGVDPQYGTLDVGGNIASRGSTFMLGIGNNSVVDSKQSRAFVKGNGDLIMNYQGDFPQGITSHSDMGFIDNKCVEMGKGIAGKDGNAGKICYNKLSDGLDIVGAGIGGAERKVKVWDRIDTGRVQANKICLGQYCIDENGFAKLPGAYVA